MKNIFYFNMNYECDNSCIFCLSHNTKNHNGKRMQMSDIQKLDYDLSGTRVILNGGECTLLYDIEEIVKLLCTRGAQVVMYTNGRKFSNKVFSEKIISAGLNRITIPIHGYKELHNALTQRESYDQTILGIQNLISQKNSNNFEIEIKFILTNELIDNISSIKELINSININWTAIDSIVVSGVVSTEYYSKNNRKKEISLVKELINMSDTYKIKIEDVNLCEICDSEISLDEEFENFYFFDYNHTEGKKINYKLSTSCKQKSKFEVCKYCNSIMDNYYILCVENGKWKRVLE